MKKIFTATLTATLAFSMIGNTGTVSAEETISGTTESSVEFVGGKHSLTSLPEDFSFSENAQINNDEMVSTTLNPLSITVVDFRGTGKGWKLNAQREEFKNVESVESLQGATLALTEQKLETGSEKSPVLNKDEKNHTVIGTDASLILTANPGDNFLESQGRGTTVLTSEATLTVPNAMASAGKNTSIITWTLTNAE